MTMSMFSKAVSQLTSSDLDELLQEKAIGNLRLEFKLLAPEKTEMLKKMSSFANTFGGYLVVGAKANSADGRLEELPGVDEISGYKQKVIQWCFDAVSPPLLVEVSDPIRSTTDQTKVYYIIYTAESDLAPHFLNGRKGVWVRTDEFSQRYDPQLAKENEIRHLLDRRKLVQRRYAALRKRSEERFQRFLTIDDNRSLRRSSACAEMLIGPRFPAQPILEHEQLTTALHDCRIDWRQSTFPCPNATLVSQYESVLFLIPGDVSNRVTFIEATIWGSLFYGTELDINIGPKETLNTLTVETSGIHIYRLVGYLLVFMEHARSMISEFGYEGPLSLHVTMRGILGVHWLYVEDNTAKKGPASELDDSFSFSVPTSAEDVRLRPDGVVLSVLRHILFGVNWSGYASNKHELEGLVRWGYQYNSWTPPMDLRI